MFYALGFEKKNILKTFFCLLFLFILWTPFLPVKAEDTSNNSGTYEIQVELPGMGKTVNMGSGPGNTIGEYVKAIYNYALGIVGILAALVIMLGGVIWLTAGGNTGRIDNAKSWITAGLTGLVIALSSYAILYTINPDLVDLQIREDIDSEGIGTQLGCCVYIDENGQKKAKNDYETECKERDGYKSFDPGKIAQNGECKEELEGCCDKGDGSCMDEITRSACEENYDGNFRGAGYECGDPSGKTGLRSCEPK